MRVGRSPSMHTVVKSVPCRSCIGRGRRGRGGVVEAWVLPSGYALGGMSMLFSTQASHL